MTMAARSSQRTAVPVDKLLSSIVVFFLPMRELSPVAASVVSVGVLLALAFLMVPLSKARRYRYSGLLLLGVALVVVCTPLLWAARGDRALNQTDAFFGLLTVLVASTHLVVLLWARGHIGIRGIAGLYAAGMAIQTVLTIDNTSGNPWKFGLAFAVTTLLLAVTQNMRPGWGVVVLVSVSLMSLAQGYRSFIVFGVITMAAWLWARRHNPRVRKPWLEVTGIAVLAYATYLVFVQLALLGVLGDRNRDVTAAQIRAAGSALAGGRTENAATFALFVHRPVGFGAGVIPTSEDVAVGSAALVSRGVNVDGTFVRDYLFGSSIKLHSVAADLWVNYGLAGLFIAAVIVWILLTGLARSLAARGTGPLLFFLPVVGLWDMAFSPIGTNLWEVVLATACLIPIKRVAEPGFPVSPPRDEFRADQFARGQERRS